MSGGSRVSISSRVRKMIHDIKEITGNHSDEDIYALLKEYNWDPNETAQKLMYLDTFHEVKRKRDRRKVNASSRSEEYRWTPGMQRRGDRGGRGNYSPPYVSEDAGGGRHVSARKENGVNNSIERGSRPPMPVLHKTENNATPRSTNSSSVSVNGSASVSNGISCNGSAPQLSAGVYSSASDPVLVPSLNSQNPGAVAAIKREIGSQRTSVESITTILDGSRSSTGQDVAKTNQAASGTGNSTNIVNPRKSQGVEERQISKPSQLSSLPTYNGSLAVIPNHDTQPPQLNGPSKVVAPKHATEAFANPQSLPENDTVLEETTSELDMKLEKLNISPHQSVIFPDHVQVPEAFKNRWTFGSLDVTVGGKGSGSVTDSVKVNSEASREPSPSNQSVSATSQDGDCPDHPQPFPLVPENLKPLEDNVSSGSVLKYEQSKQEITYPLGGPQFPVIQTPPDYNFGLAPSLIGPHLVKREGPELQSLVPSTSGSTPPATQPAAVAQSTIAVSPQLFPFFQQPYPHNYFPYSPYFPHVYMPPNAHQFLGHSGFPQQPSTGNVYLPPATATSGVKLPVPSPYKPGTNAGNLTHFGIPSTFGSYGSPAVGHSPIAVMTPGSSTGTEDLAASELKEKNIYSTVQQLQGEDSRVWTPATGRDMSSLQAKYFYNLPQGQHVAFLPAQAGHGAFSGIYHPSQTPTVQPFMHQSQAMVESVVPPSGAYQQPQHGQINWSSTLLNRENM